MTWLPTVPDAERLLDLALPAGESLELIDGTRETLCRAG